MAINDLELLVNLDDGTFPRDFYTAITRTLPTLKQSDTVNLKISAVKPTREAEFPWKYVDISSASVVAAIGQPGEGVDSGTFTVTFGANTTAALAYNITAAALDTALNALASVTSAGGVTVTGSTGGPWKIGFDAVGAQGLFSVDVTSLVPEAEAYVSEMVVGDGSTKEVQFIQIEETPLALTNSFSSLPSAAVTVNQITDGSATNNEIQRVDITDPLPYGGTFTLTYGANTTAAIAYDATAATVQTALQAIASIGANNATVTGANGIFTIEFIGTLANTSLALMTGTASGLRVPVGVQGKLDLNTLPMFVKMGAASSLQTKFEIELTTGGERLTAAQPDITILNDVIANNPPSVVTSPSSLYALEYLVTSVTSTSATLSAANQYVFVDDDTASGAVTINLPTAVGNSAVNYSIKKLGTTGNVTIDGNASETIDGATTAVLTTQYESITIVSDGTEWHII